MKKCPFCGSKDLRVLDRVEGIRGLGLQVNCKNCQAQGPGLNFNKPGIQNYLSKEEAIKFWNKAGEEK